MATLQHLSFPRGSDFYNLACFYSVLSGTVRGTLAPQAASQARSDADRAVAAFRQAVAAGFRDNGLAQTDSDLIPIRSRPDYQLLLMDMAFPVNPLAP